LLSAPRLGAILVLVAPALCGCSVDAAGGGGGEGASGSGASSGAPSSGSGSGDTSTNATGASSSASGGGTPSCANDLQNLTANGGGGVTIDAFPACIGFASETYATDYGLVWLNPGATHEYRADAGWNGGGAARFTPPNPNQAATGLGQFHIGTTPPSRLSMRWLMKAGPTMGQYANGNKTIIFVQTVNDEAHPRPMIITRPNPAVNNAFVPAPCDGTVCQYHGAPADQPWFPDGSDTFWIGGAGGYQEQWVSWEFESDLTEGWIRLYLSTEDGTFNDTLYVQNDLIDGASIAGGTFDYIDMVGGYFADGVVPDAGNWFEIDEVVISDQHIGPPAGFVE
jgi:hypothetical protein